ncbi:MAG: thioredoxin-disulfide reductase [bacterium]|nr:thioredoxin-disulfide reductase [Candidatus Aquidulcis sp.]
MTEGKVPNGFGAAIDFGAGDQSASTSTATSTTATAPTTARLLILGSGPAGLTAAIYAARAGLAPIVIGGYAPGGQLMLTSEVENFPGFPDGIDGPDLMAKMRAQAERFGSTMVDQDVDRVDLSAQPLRVWSARREFQAEAIIVATGASALWLGLESETRLRGRGVSACATCDGFFFKGQEVVVVGGGDTALEEALFLTRFATKVHLVHRRDSFRASKIMISRVEAHPNIQLHMNREVVEVLGERSTEAVLLRDTTGSLSTPERLAVGGLFVAIGHKPNTALLGGALPVDAAGYLQLESDTTASQIDGVFIAGDVHDHRYRQAVTAAGDGCRAALDAERWLAERDASRS